MRTQLFHAFVLRPQLATHPRLSCFAVPQSLEVHGAGIAPWVALLCRMEAYAHSKEAN